jgi:peptidoglycan/xylan/chitin deacetylase (PgdA/CDA1 family)
MKHCLFTLLYWIGAMRLASWWNRKRVMILCYHNVTAQTGSLSGNDEKWDVPYEYFEKHLDYLGHRHNIVSLQDYLAARRAGRTLPNYSAVLTFDDGYRNFLTVVAPCLARRGFPASVFLITDFLRNGKCNGSAQTVRVEPSEDNMYLSWSEVETLAQNYDVEFGSHSCSHPEMLKLSPEEAERELRDSRSAIAMLTGNEDIAFAFPGGVYSPRLVDQARMLGYSCALTVYPSANAIDRDPFVLRRISLGREDDEAAFAGRVSGLTEWFMRAGLVLTRLLHRSFP